MTEINVYFFADQDLMTRANVWNLLNILSISKRIPEKPNGQSMLVRVSVFRGLDFSINL